MFEEHVKITHPRETHSIVSLSLLKVFNVFSWVALLVISVLLDAEVFGHGDPSTIVHQHERHLSPSHGFYILGLALLCLQGLFVCYQALPIHNYHLDLYVHKLSIFLPVSWLLQAGAAITFSYEVFWLSGAFLLAACIIMYIAYFRLQNVPLRLMPLIFNGTHYWTVRYHITHRYGGVAARDIVVEENDVAVTFGDKVIACLHYVLAFLSTSFNLALLVFGVFFMGQVIFTGLNSFGWSIALLIALGVIAIVHLFWQQDILFCAVMVFSLISVAVARHSEATKQVYTASWVVVACVLTLWCIHLFVLQPYWTFKRDRAERNERAPLVSQ
jgi:hypothetical protein